MKAWIGHVVHHCIRSAGEQRLRVLMCATCQVSMVAIAVEDGWEYTNVALQNNQLL